MLTKNVDHENIKHVYYAVIECIYSYTPIKNIS